MIHSYKELTVWQRAMELVVEVYLLTEQFPSEERYGLASQMRRSAVSIPSNTGGARVLRRQGIAEGRFRGTKKDFLQFLRMAYASGAELETQLEIAKRLSKTASLDYSKADKFLEDVMLRSINPNKLTKLTS